MSSKLNFEKNIIENLIKSIPNSKELEKIDSLIEQIYNKKYKKIIFYAFGTSCQTIELITKFYCFHNYDWAIEILNGNDKSTQQYIEKELLKENLVIFCSRSGSTHEIIFQIKSLFNNDNLSVEQIETIKKNIIVLTDTSNLNKTYVLASLHKLKIVHVQNANSSRFEQFNAIFFFVVKFCDPKIELLDLYKKIIQPDFYTFSFNDIPDDLYIDIKNLIKSNHYLIIFSVNYMLNGMLSWFRHIWDESFGELKMNVKFENHSSLFHSSIQYYLNHSNDQYRIIEFISSNDGKDYLETDIKPYLANCKINKFIVKHDIVDLMNTMIKMIGYTKCVAEKFQVNLFSQEYVDRYKKQGIVKDDFN